MQWEPGNLGRLHPSESCAEKHSSKQRLTVSQPPPPKGLLEMKHTEALLWPPRHTLSLLRTSSGVLALQLLWQEESEGVSEKHVMTPYSNCLHICSVFRVSPVTSFESHARPRVREVRDVTHLCQMRNGKLLPPNLGLSLLSRSNCFLPWPEAGPGLSAGQGRQSPGFSAHFSKSSRAQAPLCLGLPASAEGKAPLGAQGAQTGQAAPGSPRS